MSALDLPGAIKALGKNDPPAFRYATVVAYTSLATVIKVNIDGTTMTLPCVLGPAYGVNRVVAVLYDKINGALVIGMLGTATSTISGAPIVTTPRVAAIVPNVVATWEPITGAWTEGDAKQGENATNPPGQIGAAFYGNQLLSINADTTKPYQVEIYLKLKSFFDGSAPTLHLITEGTEPGVPTMHESVAGPALFYSQGGAYIVLPTSWALLLLSGARACVCINGTTVMSLPSQADDAASMALRVNYYA